MNIHLPAILMFTRCQGFDPSPYIYLPLTMDISSYIYIYCVYIYAAITGTALPGISMYNLNRENDMYRSSVDGMLHPFFRPNGTGTPTGTPTGTQLFFTCWEMASIASSNLNPFAPYFRNLLWVRSTIAKQMCTCRAMETRRCWLDLGMLIRKKWIFFTKVERIEVNLYCSERSVFTNFFFYTFWWMLFFFFPICHQVTFFVFRYLT